MIDLGLWALAKKAVATKPRKFVTPAILCAVVLQESHGQPTFKDTKPGSQFDQNLRTAQCYSKHFDKPTKGFTLIKTGLVASQIRGWVTIPAKVGDYVVPRFLVGQYAKFRLEPSYWERNKELAPADRFLYSCSWGLCQFMAPNISKEPTPEGLQFIRRFAADPLMQLVYGAGMIEQIMSEGHDVYSMYREYNSGSANSTNPDVEARAANVAALAIQIAQSTKGL